MPKEKIFFAAKDEKFANIQTQKVFFATVIITAVVIFLSNYLITQRIYYDCEFRAVIFSHLSFLRKLN